jgi:hypothetical protein
MHSLTMARSQPSNRAPIVIFLAERSDHQRGHCLLPTTPRICAPAGIRTIVSATELYIHRTVSVTLYQTMSAPYQLRQLAGLIIAQGE